MAVAARKQDGHPLRSPEFTVVYDIRDPEAMGAYKAKAARSHEPGRALFHFDVTVGGRPYAVLTTLGITRKQAETIAAVYDGDGTFAFEMDLGDQGNKEYVDGVIRQIAESGKRGK